MIEEDLLSKNNKGTKEELSEEDKIVEYLMPFKDGILTLPKLYLMKIGLQFMLETVLLASTIMGPLIILAVNFSFIGQSGSVALQAAFGISNSFITVFFNGLNIYNLDKVGIALSVELGKGRYFEVKRAMSQGVVTICFFFFTITLPLLLYSGSFLIFAGVDETTSMASQHILRLLIIPLFMEMASSLLRTFCMSQGFEQEFSVVGIINTIVCTGLSYFLVVSMDLEVFGFILAKFTYELVNILIGVYVMVKRTPQETRGIVGFEDVKLGLWDFMVDTFKYSMGSYTEVLGCEFTSLLVARLNNSAQVSAFMAMINVNVSFYTFGIALGIIGRTRLNIFMGKGLFQTASNLFRYVHMVGMAMGLIISLILTAIKPQVARFYSGNSEEVFDYVMTMLTIYTFTTMSETSVATSFVGIKTVGKIMHLLAINIVNLVLLNAIIGITITVMGGQCVAFYIGLMFVVVSHNVVCYVMVVMSDWSLAVSKESGGFGERGVVEDEAGGVEGLEMKVLGEGLKK